MTMRGGVWLALWAVLCAAPESAQAKTWTLDEAVDAAVRNNLSLQRTAWDLEAKERQNEKAWNVFLPSATVSSTLSRANTTTNSVTGADVMATTTASASARFSLSLSGNVLASLEAVALNYRTGLTTYDLAKRSLEKSVRLAFYSLLLEQENMKLTRDSIDRAQKSLAKVQANYKAGLVPDIDVLTAQVSLESLKPQYQQLEATHLNNLGQFKVLLGIPLDDELDLGGDLTQPLEKSLDLGSADLGQVSPDVQKAQLSVDTYELNKKSLDLNSWFPSVSLAWSTAPAMLDVFDEVYTTRAAKDWQDSGTLSLTASYTFDSLIPWTTSKENLLQADDSLRKARNQLQETKVTSELNRQNYLRSISQAVQSLTSLEFNVQLAQKTYDLSQAAYSQGAKDLLAVQSAEGDLDSARYKVLAQRYTLLSNVLSLEYELNVPFGTLLEGVKK